VRQGGGGWGEGGGLGWRLECLQGVALCANAFAHAAPAAPAVGDAFRDPHPQAPATRPARAR
jgi:hypothetical protein